MPHAIPDRAAFSSLVQEHQRRVFFHVLRLCRGDEQLARDVTQKTFLKAWGHRAEFRGEAAITTWLLRIAHNLALNEMRRAHRHRELQPEHQENLGAVESGAYEAVAEARDRAALRQAVHDLPPRQREVTLLRLYQDLSFPEIGEVLGITGNNAKVHFHHARKTLQQRLSQGGAA